jgi:Methionine synthase II (cobalamin-independent)
MTANSAAGPYWSRFVEGVEGFTIKPAVFKFRDDAGHEVEFTAPYAAGKLRRVRPLALDEFNFVKSTTKATPKVTLPSPSTMHFYRCTDFADKSVYADVETFFADLARVFQEEIADLVKAGCRYIQLDEVAIALLCDPAIRRKVEDAGQNPDRLVDLYIKSLNDAVAGAPADVVFGVHMCRGNFKGHYLAAGGYESVAERFFHQHQGQSLPA